MSASDSASRKVLFGLKPNEKDVLQYVLGEDRAGSVRYIFNEVVWESKEALRAFLDHFQATLDGWRTGTQALGDDVNMETMFRRGSRLLVKISRDTREIPPSLFVNNIALLNIHAVAGGGFADIFRASYIGNAVALKRLSIYPSHHDYAQIFPMFAREAVIWRQLEHPNILPFFGVDVTTFPPMPCMVSPWMDHGHILDYAKNKLPSVIEVHRLCFEILAGLVYLHSCSIVHGDLRSPNILIDEQEHVRLADFGLSESVGATASRVTSMGGSARWMAPELLRVEPSIDQSISAITYAIDIYAFGCVVLELYTHDIPFRHIQKEPTVMLDKMRGNHPLRPEGRDCVLEISDALWSLMEDCWDSNPRTRIPIPALKSRLVECRPDSNVTVIELTPSERDVFLRILGSSTIGALRGDCAVWQSNDAVKVFLDHCQVALDEWRSHIQPSDELTNFKLWIRSGTSLLIKASQHLKILSSPLFLSGITPESKPWMGYGRIGDISRALHLGQLVALKHLKKHRYTSEPSGPEMPSQFIQQVIMWRQLHHPNILQFLGVNMDAYERPCSVSPWMMRGPVLDYLKDRSTNVALIHNLCYEIICGLTYLHDYAIVHGNLQGSNILIDNDEHVRIGGFGTSCGVGQTVLSTQLGGYRWMPPESLSQGSTEKTQDTAVDVWSYACVVLELYTLKMPFWYFKSEARVVWEIMRGVHPARPALMPDAMWAFMEECWNPDPARRLPSSALRQRFAKCTEPYTAGALNGPAITAVYPPTGSASIPREELDELYPESESEEYEELSPEPATLDEKLEAHYGVQSELYWTTYKRGNMWTAIFLVENVEKGRGEAESKELAKEQAANQALQDRGRDTPIPEPKNDDIPSDTVEMGRGEAESKDTTKEHALDQALQGRGRDTPTLEPRFCGLFKCWRFKRWRFRSKHRSTKRP